MNRRRYSGNGTLPSPLDIDDEAVPSLLRDDLLPGVVNTVHRMRVISGLILCRAQKFTISCVSRNASCIRPRNGVSVQHETHLADFIGIDDLTDPDSAVDRISLQERNEAISHEACTGRYPEQSRNGA